MKYIAILMIIILGVIGISTQQTVGIPFESPLLQWILYAVWAIHIFEVGKDFDDRDKEKK